MLCFLSRHFEDGKQWTSAEVLKATTASADPMHLHLSLSVSPPLCVCLRLSVPQCHSAALCVSRRLSKVLCPSLCVTGTPALNVARAGKQSTSAKVPKATPASADPNETGRCVTGQQIGLILFTCKTYTTNSDNRW